MRHCDRPFLRLALIGALVASLGLAACGRKGPLDPPPGASLAGEQPVTASASRPGPTGRIRRTGRKTDRAGGTNKRIPLDVLLN